MANVQTSDNLLHLTSEEIERYMNAKLDSGVSAVTVAKYKNAFNNLQTWLGDDTLLTAERLQQWRRFLETSGYSKNTVQNYVKRINDFLRLNGRKELCIPKPLRYDLRNQTFGYLTAIEPTEKRSRTDIVWRCVCRCGREAEITAAQLISGNARSCGHCSRSESIRYHMRMAEHTSIRRALKEDAISTRNASGYTSVYKKRDKWTAMVEYKKQRYNLGVFDKVEDAAQARARVKEWIVADGQRMEQQYAHLFAQKPTLPEPQPMPKKPEPEPVAIQKTRLDNTSGHQGVGRHREKWYAKINYKGVRYHLGSYSTMDEAVAVRQQAEACVKQGDLAGLTALCTSQKHVEAENQ